MFSFSATNAWAADKEDPFILPKVVAVENKLYEPKYDLTGQLGVLPLDAFFKAVTAGLSYTYYMNSYLGWEVLNGHYASVEDTGLKKDLLSNFSAKPVGILDSIKYMATTSIVYTPIYSKNLFFNESLRYSSISFIGSAGTVGFTSNDNGALLGMGLVVRFFSSQSISYKFDSRLYYHTAKLKSSDLILAIVFGLSYEFGSKKNPSTIE
jgi:outer membrane beta-barrel protein